MPIEEEQTSVVKLFRKKNPTLNRFEVIQTWEHKFNTFIEWTILLRVITS